MEDAKVLNPAFEAMETAMRREAQARAAGKAYLEATIRAEQAKVEYMNSVMAVNTAMASEAFKKSAGVEAAMSTSAAKAKKDAKLVDFRAAQAAALEFEKAWGEATVP